MKFSSDGRYLLVTSDNWDCRFSPSPCFVTSSDTKAWDIKTLQASGTLPLETGESGQKSDPKVDNLPLSPLEQLYQRFFVVLPDNKTVVVEEISLGLDDFGYHKIEFWDLVTRKRRFALNVQDYFRQPFSASRTGLCVLWNTKGAIEIWNYFTGKRAMIINGGHFSDPIISPDGSTARSFSSLKTNQIQCFPRLGSTSTARCRDIGGAIAA